MSELEKNETLLRTGDQGGLLEQKISEVASRIKALRLDMGLSTKDMAEKVEITEEEYVKYEEGQEDFSFTFVYKVANLCGVEISELMEGTTPALREYAVTRKGEGLPITRRAGYKYMRLGHLFRNKLCEPFEVTIPYSEEALNPPYKLVTHSGQELNIVTKGCLKVMLRDHSEILYPGDSIFFDSRTPHNEYAIGGEDCTFYAIVLNPEKWTQGATYEKTVQTSYVEDNKTNFDLAAVPNPVYRKYVTDTLDANNKLTSITYTPEADKFNFAFDLVDAMADKDPNKTSMMWVAKDGKTDHRFTFEEMKKFTAMTANYFESLGIKHGDRVMLVLKRHYQFWFSILALHKIGAIAIPATNLLKEHDFDYRFKSAGVSAIVITGNGDTALEAQKAAENAGLDITLVMANGADDEAGVNLLKVLEGKASVDEAGLKSEPVLFAEGANGFLPMEGMSGKWHNFNYEMPAFSDVYERPANATQGDDPMVMFFTSGTTGYPKIAAHSHKYSLGHFATAKYWHNVDPNGLHFTISDTGWGKSLWGKLYGQWLCEAPTFTFDFDRFHANEILPMFAKYHVTTFCAPPTMYRFLVKEDLSQYDLTSLKYATVAGEALNPEVFNQFMRATGIRLMEGFGQTETSLVIGNLVGSAIRLGSMGKAVTPYDVHILDEDGNDCPPGTTGEICIKTTEVVPCGLYLGYYRNEEKTKESWHDGYFHTGDTAWKDEDGYIWYVGRVDDVIKSSGYRIGPFEIESVIMELPYVLECAVTGTPDPQGVRGMVVKATIVLVPGRAEPTEELKKEIQEYVKTNTAPYKYPRVVEFVTELPKTISGKIKRNVIRDGKDS